MNGKVEQVGAVKVDKKGNSYFSVKIGNQWYSTPGDEEYKQKVTNRMVSYSVTREKQGQFNAWIKVDAVEDPVVEQVNSGNNGNSHGITWESYEAMAQLAHGLASNLEPDHLKQEDGETVSVAVDRSAARAAILNTVMIAFSNGKIIAPLDPDDAPF